MPIDNDCPKDSERLVKVDHWKAAQADVNEAIAVDNLVAVAGEALAVLKGLYPNKNGEPISLVARLEKAIKKVEREGL